MCRRGPYSRMKTIRKEHPIKHLPPVSLQSYTNEWWREDPSAYSPFLSADSYRISPILTLLSHFKNPLLWLTHYSECLFPP
mmetsp:Transcript_34401/g.48865  ORF Transcript_34401/g.48865 Transcript_34401/m.48865 type:complete len:81 (-) Transcript_34401:593-835(-)